MNKYQMQRVFILTVAGGILAFLVLVGMCSLLEL
jgi:hypothetical protein